jgi:hypothetical protein
MRQALTISRGPVIRHDFSFLITQQLGLCMIRSDSRKSDSGIAAPAQSMKGHGWSTYSSRPLAEFT